LFPISPTTEAMLMIRPQRRFIIPRCAARIATNAERRFVSRTASQSSSFIRSIRLSFVMPALFTRMSQDPKASSTACTSVVTSAGTRMSQANPRASPSSSATCSAFASSRPTTATFAPHPISVRAISRPMPRVDPVTRATLPERSIFMVGRGSG
jgi:hypothetical protein